jgi:hypothetical protein
MGIFSLFNKKPIVPRTDLVWLTSAAKCKGILDYLKKNRIDLCVAWFEETQRAFNRYLNEENHMNIEIKMAESLRLYDLNNKTAVFLEHYPLYTREANLLSDNKPENVCFMNSLDDTFFQLYRGNMTKLMQSMGLEEDQYIEDGLVSKAVIQAQKRLDKKIRDDFHARSAEEWMDRFRTYYQQHMQ